MDDDDEPAQQTQNVIQEQKPSNGNNLLDLMGEDEPVAKNNSSHFSTTAGYGNAAQTSDISSSQINSFATTANGNQSGVFNFFDNSSSNVAEPAKPRNIVIPLVEVLPNNETSRQGKYSGLSIKAAF